MYGADPDIAAQASKLLSFTRAMLKSLDNSWGRIGHAWAAQAGAAFWESIFSVDRDWRDGVAGELPMGHHKDSRHGWF
jgi:hypothetical protein